MDPSLLKPLVTLAAASATETLLYPIDSIKTWSQVKKKGPSQFKAFPLQHYSTVIGQAYRRGGCRAFFHGLPFAVARNGLSTMVVLGFGKKLNANFKKVGILTPAVSKAMTSMLLATASNGALAPIETLKIRMQADGRRAKHKQRYNGPYSAATTFIKRNGFFSLWNGSAPMLLRSTAWWVTAIPVYTGTKEMVMSQMGTTEEHAAIHSLASIVSGACATIASHPFDVVRVKLANQSLNRPVYTGMVHCFMKILRRDQGAKGLYKGILARYTRLGPWQLIFWVIYEKSLLLATGKGFNWN
jgi:hypothetical protein